MALHHVAVYSIGTGFRLPARVQPRMRVTNRVSLEYVRGGGSADKFGATPTLPGTMIPTHKYVNSFMVASGRLVYTYCPPDIVPE